MKSQLMTQAELARLQASGKTLEQDERGIKVTLLPDGNLLKVFRLRGWFSSSFIYSNARSFCRNAQRLHERNIPTVNIIQLIHFERSTNTAALYEPLAGETLNTLVKNNQLTVHHSETLGIFIAKLHEKGIHFKSLHFGNIILNPQGNLGLIDIADMRIFPWALHISTRLRCFKRLLRYQQDMKLLGADNLAMMINAYVNAANISARQQLREKLNLMTQQVMAKN